MVTLSTNWTQVPAQETCKLPEQFNTKGTKGSAFSTVSLEFHYDEDCNINFLEHVTVYVEFSFSRYRGDTEIYLKSPSGTTSHILTYRPFDSFVYYDRGDLSWTYMSVHYWGEDPNGTWELLFRSHHGFSAVIVKEWSITLYGTETDPYLGDNQLLTDKQRINQNDGSNDTYIIIGAVIGLSTLLAIGIILLKKKSVSTIVPSKSISKESTCKIISHT
ncbi:neuroendocrine convertase 2-like [Mytilus galloprovincialis]|uniref:neuroendocrine convertase 2-like n=1 Tax=Mytilus galloprovincialis TaxID=29158 RepID=UPI003F7BE34B